MTHSSHPSHISLSLSSLSLSSSSSSSLSLSSSSSIPSNYPLYVSAGSMIAPGIETRDSPFPEFIETIDDQGWVTIEGKFTFVTLANCSHLSYDAQLAPHAHLSDSCMDLVIVRRASKPAMAAFMINLEDGTHIESDFCEYIKVSAFYLEPLPGEYTCMIGIDGEQTNNKPILVTLIPAAIRLLGAT